MGYGYGHARDGTFGDIYIIAWATFYQPSNLPKLHLKFTAFRGFDNRSEMIMLQGMHKHIKKKELTHMPVAAMQLVYVLNDYGVKWKFGNGCKGPVGDMV